MATLERDIASDEGQTLQLKAELLCRWEAAGLGSSDVSSSSMTAAGSAAARPLRLGRPSPTAAVEWQRLCLPDLEAEMRKQIAHLNAVLLMWLHTAQL